MGRILVIEFKDQDSSMFDEIIAILKRYPNIDNLQLNEETVLSLPGLEINLDRRKVYCNQKEIILTVKEYEILCLLCKNIGRVLTYEQIYQTICGQTLWVMRKEQLVFMYAISEKRYSPLSHPHHWQ